MQKFGLKTTNAGRHTALELELTKEQASSLGRTGKKLRLSLENYQSKQHEGLSLEQNNKLLEQISNNV